MTQPAPLSYDYNDPEVCRRVEPFRKMWAELHDVITDPDGDLSLAADLNAAKWLETHKTENEVRAWKKVEECAREIHQLRKQVEELRQQVTRLLR